jgi:hypothetical protein
MKILKRYNPALLVIIVILLGAVYCGKDAPTVNPGDYVSGCTTCTGPGYYYPFVTAVYPTGLGVPLDSKFVIVFNMPVDSADFASQITATGAVISGITPSANSTIATITFVTPLPATTPITVTVGAGIHENVSGTNILIVLTAGVGYTWTFTTGSAPDLTAPSVTITGANPTPPNGTTGVSLTAPNITFVFNNAPGDLDPTSINSNTFYLEDSLFNLIASTYTYTSATNTITLIPSVNLTPGVTYTATLYSNGTSTGIKDLSGNFLPAINYSWSFTTTGTPIDPAPGNPTLSAGPNVPYITSSTASITWTTSEPTNYTIHYGLGDNASTSIPFLSDYSSTHAYLLNPPLSPGKRYFTYITYQDFAGNPIAPATTSTVEFNTETNEVPFIIDNTQNNQTRLNWITYHPSAGNTGSFMFWSDLVAGNYYLYGKLFNSGLGDVWGVGTRKALYTGSSTTYLSSVEDGLGGVIITTTQSGSDIYNKHIDSTGSFVNWGAGTTTSAGSGLRIDSTGGTFASGAPVYNGFITRRTPGNGTSITEMSNIDNPVIPYPIFDFTRDFSSGYNTGDYVYRNNGTTGSAATITLSNYRYGVAQSSALISAGNTYQIFNQTARVPSETAVDHHTYVSTTDAQRAPAATYTFVNGSGLYIYTDHNITGSTVAGDLVRYNDGSNHFALVNNTINTVGAVGALVSGGVTFPPSYTLEYGAPPYFGVFEDDLNLGPTGFNVQNRDFIILNNGSNHLSRINNTAAYNYYYVLTLTPIQGGNITLNTTDTYYIYYYNAGAFALRTSGQPAPYGGFTNYIWDDNNTAGLATVQNGDFVLIESSPMRITGTANHCEVSLNSATVSNGDTYYIYNPALTLRVNGTAKAGSGVNFLIDTINLTTPGVAVNDWAFIGSPLSTVTGVYNYYVLGLANGMSVSAGADYCIYNGTTYVANGIVDTGGIGNFQDYNLSLSAAAINNNIIIGTSTTINTVPTNNTLTLTNGMTVTTGQNYYIYNGTTYVDSGTATAGSGLNLLEDISKTWTINGYNGYTIIIGTATTINSRTYPRLTLSNSFSIPITTGYSIYSDTALSTLVVSGNDIVATTGEIQDDIDLGSVSVGNYVIIPSQSQYTRITAFTHYRDLTLSNGAYTVSPGADYYISNAAAFATLPGDKQAPGAVAYSGTPAIGNGYLRALYGDLNGYGVAINDWIVIDAYADIANAAGHVYYYRFAIDDNSFGINNTNAYSIYRYYCFDHLGSLNQFTGFRQIPIDWNFGLTSAVGTFYAHAPRAANSTASSMPFYNPATSYPLLDNDGGLGSVTNGDIVLNYTTGTWATVNDNTWRASGAIGINADLMRNGDSYEIISINSNLAITQNNIIDIGSAQALTVGLTLVTDGVGLNGSINAGDIAYNVTDNDYAMITNAAGTTLTLSRNANFGVGDRYAIIHCAGVLNVWYNGTNVRASIRSLTDGTTVLRAEYTLVAGASNPITITDGNGNMYLIYISGGNLNAGFYNAAGNAIWTSGAISAVTAIHKVISDNNGGLIVLYQNGGTMYARRIRNLAGAYNSPWNGNAVTAAPTSFDIVCNSTASDVIVAGAVGGDIYAWRFGGTPWTNTISTATGIQQNPKIFVNSWTAGAGNFTTLVWEDSRFYSNSGYGIFGMQVQTSNGTVNNPVWRVNTNTPDYNGAAVILNSGNMSSPLNIQIVPYNSGTNAVLIWEDWRDINATLPYEGSDMLYINISGFTPY